MYHNLKGGCIVWLINHEVNELMKEMNIYTNYQTIKKSQHTCNCTKKKILDQKKKRKVKIFVIAEKSGLRIYKNPNFNKKAKSKFVQKW